MTYRSPFSVSVDVVLSVGSISGRQLHFGQIDRVNKVLSLCISDFGGFETRIAANRARVYVTARLAEALCRPLRLVEFSRDQQWLLPGPYLSLHGGCRGPSHLCLGSARTQALMHMFSIVHALAENHGVTVYPICKLSSVMFDQQLEFTNAYGHAVMYGTDESFLETLANDLERQSTFEMNRTTLTQLQIQYSAKADAFLSINVVLSANFEPQSTDVFSQRLNRTIRVLSSSETNVLEHLCHPSKCEVPGQQGHLYNAKKRSVVQV